MPEQDFSRLSSAMVVSIEYAQKVLNPATRMATIRDGYLKEKFGFTDDELKLLMQVDVILSLEEKDREKIWETVAKFWSEVGRLQNEGVNP